MSASLKEGHTISTNSGKSEDPLRKRKSEINSDIESCRLSRPKQTKLDIDVQNESSDPCLTQLLGTTKDPGQENTSEQTKDSESMMNGLTKALDNDGIKIDTRKKKYRLTIQIDKVIDDFPDSTSPTSQDPVFIINPELNHSNRIEEQNDKIASNIDDSPCAKNGCQLKPKTFDSKPGLQCEVCKKYYIKDTVEKQEPDNHACSVCGKSFNSPDSLSDHIETHFICDICPTVCGSRMAYNKHLNLHKTYDESYPYKCHQCEEIFVRKVDIQKHYPVVHPNMKISDSIKQLKITSLASQLSSDVQLSLLPPTRHTEDITLTKSNPYNCSNCNASFRMESAYKNHLPCDKKIESNNSVDGSSSTTGNQTGVFRSIKITCRLCSMEFDNVGDVDKHTRTHLEHTLGEHKCNVCKKQFKSIDLLNDHMKNHFPHRHFCSVCSKMFINRTTMKIHMRMHNEG